MIYGVPWRRFFSDLYKEITDDNVFNGAAALAYYLTLSIFPAMLVLLAILPYLPIENLDQAIWDLLRQVMPDQATQMFSGVIQEITSNRKAGLLSLGLLGTVWAATNGTYAIMQELNITYDVREGRSFLKARGTAIALTFAFGALIIVAFTLIVLGGEIQEWIAPLVGGSQWLLATFAGLRWLIVTGAILLAFAMMYYFGPDVEQDFKFITPGSIGGTILLIGASLGLRVYATNFGDYNATYGSIGAVVLMMLWLYVAGLVILLGSEVNALVEHYSPEGKDKGEKVERKAA